MTGEQNPTTIDLSTKIKTPDGKEISVGDLVTQVSKLQTDLATAQEAAKSLETFRTNTRAIFEQGVSEEGRQTALRNVLKDVGFSQQAIDAQLAGASNPADEEPEDPTDGGEEDGVSALNQQIKALQEQLAAIQTERKGETKTNLQNTLNARIDSFLQKDAGARAILKRAEKKGEQALANVRKTLVASLDREVKGVLRSRIEGGERFSESMFDDAITKVGAGVVEPFQSVIGGSDDLGRTPETVAGIETILKKQPVPAPEYKPGMTVGDVEKQADDFFADALIRDLAEVEQSESLKV